MATNSPPNNMNLFNRARLKLTLYYTLIIAVVVCIFSFVIYRNQIGEITRFEQVQRERLEMRLQQGMGVYPMGQGRGFILIDQELLDSTRDRILTRIVFIDTVIILLSSLMGYLLAGITLHPIEEMVKEQGRFVGDASHELRTPLTILTTSLEVYRRDKNKTEKKTEEILSSTLEEVKRLSSLSNSLLSLSTHSNSPPSLELDLNIIVKKTIDLFKSNLRNRQINLTSKLENVKIKGDKEAISELMTILLDNAVKYNNKAKGKIKVQLRKKGHHAVLTVEDNGIGISRHDLPHIFDRFYRADTARSSDGYGLGLALAKKIVTAHHSKIEVESRIGKGSVFTVTFPLA